MHSSDTNTVELQITRENAELNKLVAISNQQEIGDGTELKKPVLSQLENFFYAEMFICFIKTQRKVKSHRQIHPVIFRTIHVQLPVESWRVSR